MLNTNEKCTAKKEKAVLVFDEKFSWKIRAQAGTYRMYCATITFIQADMKIVRVYFYSDA